MLSKLSPFSDYVDISGRLPSQELCNRELGRLCVVSKVKNLKPGTASMVASQQRTCTCRAMKVAHGTTCTIAYYRNQARIILLKLDIPRCCHEKLLSKNGIPSKSINWKGNERYLVLISAPFKLHLDGPTTNWLWTKPSKISQLLWSSPHKKTYAFKTTKTSWTYIVVNKNKCNILNIPTLPYYPYNHVSKPTLWTSRNLQENTPPTSPVFSFPKRFPQTRFPTRYSHLSPWSLPRATSGSGPIPTGSWKSLGIFRQAFWVGNEEKAGKTGNPIEFQLREWYI